MSGVAQVDGEAELRRAGVHRVAGRRTRVTRRESHGHPNRGLGDGEGRRIMPPTAPFSRVSALFSAHGTFMILTNMVVGRAPCLCAQELRREGHEDQQEGPPHDHSCPVLEPSAVMCS